MGMLLMFSSFLVLFYFSGKCFVFGHFWLSGPMNGWGHCACTDITAPSHTFCDQQHHHHHYHCHHHSHHFHFHHHHHYLEYIRRRPRSSVPDRTERSPYHNMCLNPDECAQSWPGNKYKKKSSWSRPDKSRFLPLLGCPHIEHQGGGSRSPPSYKFLRKRSNHWTVS